MIGDLKGKKQLSSYQPPQAVIDITKVVKEDYVTGVDIIQRGYVELNNRSVIEDTNRGQMMFNAFVDTSFEDPSEAWQWRGTRSMARNKGIAMHSQLTANYLLPLFIAQNSDDEVDVQISEIMQDIIEWMAQPINSDYQTSFMQLVFSMETNPVTFLGAEYCEVFQKIKEKKADGGYTKKEILDEVLSGFKAPIYSPNQVLITNAYQRNIQRQKAIIERCYKDYHELEAKYGKHPNWVFVQEGIKSVYNDEDGLFYDIKDDIENDKLVAEEIYKNRREDLEIPFVNGIYMGNANVENNPIKHRDNRNAPKYNKIPFGFNRIGDHFFYYKSMMNVLSWDNMLIDAVYEVGMNDELLRANMPIAISGSDKIDSEVMFPNAVITLEDKDSKINPLLPPRQGSILNTAMPMIEQSMDESSLSKTLAGQLPEASQKAYTVAQSRADAKKILGAVGKSLAESMVLYGDLMKDIAINNITVPQVQELVGGQTILKYPKFFLDNKKSGGGMGNRTIKFDESLMGRKMTKKEKKYKSMELLEQSGYPDKKDSIALVNPEIFAKFKYLCKVDVTQMFSKTNEYMQELLSQLRAMLANDPYIDMEALDKKLVYSFFQSEGDELIKKQPEQAQLVVPNNKQEQPAMMGKTSTSINNIQ